MGIDLKAHGWDDVEAKLPCDDDDSDARQADSSKKTPVETARNVEGEPVAEPAQNPDIDSSMSETDNQRGDTKTVPTDKNSDSTNVTAQKQPKQFRQMIENLPAEIRDAPRYFRVKADKRPIQTGWSNPENQRPAAQIDGVKGFDTSGHDVGVDYLFVDFDHTQDDDGNFLYPDAERWYKELISVGENVFCERSISGHGLHMFFVPTANKFASLASGTNASIVFDKETGAKIELFYRTGGRYCLVTGDLFGCTHGATIPHGEVADEVFQKLLSNVTKKQAAKNQSLDGTLFQPARVDEKKSTHTEPKQSNETPEYDEYRAMKMLDIIAPADLTDSEWLAVISACKNVGVAYSVVDQFNGRDPARYDATENQKRWDSLKDSSYTINKLHGIAKRFGYVEADVWSEYHGTQKRGSSVTASTPTADNDDEKLFTGWQEIPINAGLILNVEDDKHKPALTSLFVDANFTDFVSEVSMLNTDAQVDETPFGDSGLTQGEVLFALKWLAVKMFRYFKTVDETKSFVVERLSAANAKGALKLVDDAQFWEGVTATATVVYRNKIFAFDYRFRRKIIDCANHSKGYRGSLERFDVKRLTDFLNEPEFTDVTCAELLIKIQGEFMKFDREQGTWYTWTGHYWRAVQIKSLSPLYSAWVPLARKIRAFAERETFRLDCIRAEYAMTLTPVINHRTDAETKKLKRLENAVKAMKAKVSQATILESSRKIGNVFEQASGLPEIAIVTSQLDSNPLLFNCANVTINLETMETYPARQSDLITMSANADFDKTATCDDWDKFLLTAIPDEKLRDWLQRFFGTCLSGDTSEHIFLFIHGVGGSGKTTFLNAIGGALGDYAKMFSVDAICVNKKQKDGDEPSPALASLRACRLARSSETRKNRRLDESVVKRWTGSDPLPARELHKPQFTFKPSFKLVVDGNFALRVSDINDEGLRRRLRIAPFNNPPTDDNVDTKLAAKLSTDKAKSAILNWMLVGWQKYQQRGLKDIPAAIETALKNYYDANDVMAEFLEAHNYETGDKRSRNYRLPVKDAWEAYQRWQLRTPTASIMARADFVDAFLRATAKDGVELRDDNHTNHFFGCMIETLPHNYPPDRR